MSKKILILILLIPLSNCSIDNKTGICIMQMEKGLDTGDILDVIEVNIQDSDTNHTRFVIMSKELNKFDIKEKDIMTTIIYQVRSIPAALYKSLGGFATNGVNITKLESYIHPQGFDVAQFYVDIEGHPDTPSVKLALDDLKFYSKKCDIIGVYKAANFRKK